MKTWGPKLDCSSFRSEGEPGAKFHSHTEGKDSKESRSAGGEPIVSIQHKNVFLCPDC